MDAICQGPREVAVGTSGDGTLAQSFTAQGSGVLGRAQVDVNKDALDIPGDYVLRIYTADGSGTPTGEALASTTVPDGAVFVGDGTLVGTFEEPATVIAGQRYALGVTRPGSDNLAVGARTGDDCAGALFSGPSPAGPFSPGMAGFDMVFAVLVAPSPGQDTDPPETVITKGPRDKTRKRTASFEFTSDEPGSSFACAVDGQVLKVPCTSPYTVKVKRGRHSFQVQATDPAGNADGAAATDDWKVKRKRKR